jgi:WD40 repeat protein
VPSPPQPAAPVTGTAAKPEPPRAKAPSLGDVAQEKEPAKLTAKEAASLKQHTAAVTRLAFHRTSPILASAGKDGRVLLWNLQTGGLPLQLHKFNEEVWAVKFSPDGMNLAFANRNWWGSRLVFKTVAAVQLNEVKNFKNGGGAVASIAYSHDGRFFAAGQDDGTIRLWDIAQFRELAPVGLGERHNVFNLAFGPATLDRRNRPTGYVLAEGGEDGVVRTFRGAIGNDGQWSFQQTDAPFPQAGAVLGLRFSPDGKLLGFARVGGHVCLCDPQGQNARDLARGGGSAEWIAFHPRNPWCVTAHKDAQAARIWNTSTAELLCELKGHTGGVMCAEFSPDGRQVATASEDFSIKLWDLTGPGVTNAADQQLDDVVEHGRQKDSENRHSQHTAEDRGAERAAHFGAGTHRNHQRHHAQDEGKRRHHDRPQTQLARLQRGLVGRHPRLVPYLGELDDQNRVLAG